MTIDEIEDPKDDLDDVQKGQKDFKKENGPVWHPEQTALPAKRKAPIKKIIIYAAVVIILTVGIFVLKSILFKKPANPVNFFPAKSQTKPIINRSSSFPDITGKQALPASPGSLAQPVNQKPSGVNNFIKEGSAVKKSSSVNNNKVSAVPAIPPMPAKSIKEMLKFNTEVNELGQKVKIARLKQEIKNLHQNPAGGTNFTSESDISLVAITKTTAIIAFGKHDVSMRVGMIYGGYRCLIITSSGVALEKNNRVVNLSLSM